MKFGHFALAQCEGALLAHSLRLPSGRLAKGSVLDAAALEAIAAAGIDTVTAAKLDVGDVPENEAAGRIAEALARRGIVAADAATGRANLFAEAAGLFLPDKSVVDALNRIDPAITLATLPAFAAVQAGRMVATVKIIPLAVNGAALAAALGVLTQSPAFRLAPFRARPVALIQTRLDGVKDKTLDKTARVLATRLEPSGSIIEHEARVAHEATALAQALREAQARGAQMAVVFGASAVIDTQDVVPSGILQAGGIVQRLGMPVDPGNLLLLGALGAMRIVGAPGCARSPKENGFDWVLNRLLADLDVFDEAIHSFGVGGLLDEIVSRPQPREAVAESPAPRVAGVVLAAGRSSRMGRHNKLLAEFDGVPLVRRSVETALASGVSPVYVVLGDRADEIERALDGLPVIFVQNERFADGLSTSLSAGFREAYRDAEGVLVMLADQPALQADHLRSLADSFRERGEGSIVVATDRGKRRNPVVLTHRLAKDVGELTGDVGARGIIAAHEDWVVEVEIGPAAGLDVDTPELLALAGGRIADAEP